MYSHRILITITTFIVLSMTSCVKDIDKYDGDLNTTGQVTDISEMQVPANFSYSNDKKVSFSLALKTNTDAPMPGIKVSIWSNLPENNGYPIFKGVTNASGEIISQLTVPKTLKEVVIRTSYVGLPENAIADISSGSFSMALGGSNPQKIRKDIRSGTSASMISTASRNSNFPLITHMGTWNTQGVPSYLSGAKEAVNADYLRRINGTIPEYLSVPVRNPHFVGTGASPAVEITQTADIWMTFVHEGSPNRNSIGYYKYNKYNPPATVNDIAEIKLVFPNLSYTNSGGGLIPGDKVYLGTIGPDTMIGFVLLTNAYDLATATVGNGNSQYYSDKALNAETNAIKQTHHVMLWDDTESKMLIGFEESNRSSGCDDDFNDAVVFITANPSSAIASSTASRTAAPVDSDGDGISDTDDEYPSDPDLAFNNYYPGEKAFGYLAFEDLWPYKGDYDLNDLLVGYRMNQITNANNDVKEVQAKIFVKAAGGSYQHGFGIEFPVPGYFIETVNGPIYSENYVSVNSNGTEANQNNAVVIVFDNSNTVAPCQSGYYVNTEPGSPVISSDTIRLAVRFVAGIPQNTLGPAPFNPFLISNKRRGYEIHLPDKPPTALADAALFNTGQDKSNMALGRYYKSANNLPWCINIPSDFPIITEKTAIIDAYLHFVDWAQSGGVLFPDWYEDKPGYRDNNKLLHR